jgi:exopolysaccharide biosynthesis polyprenyl glycosylphosphotransferase
MGAHGPAPFFVPARSSGLYWQAFPVMCGVLFAIGVMILTRIHGLQNPKEDRSAIVEFLFVAQSVCLAAFGLYGALHFFDMGAVAREALPVEIGLTSVALLICRMLSRRARERRLQLDIAVRNLIIVGDDEVGRGVRHYLETLLHSGYRFCGFVRWEKGTGKTQADDEVIGSVEDVISLAKSKFADEIILSKRPATELLVSVLDQADAAGIDVRVVPSLSEVLTNRADVEYIGDLPTVVLRRKAERAVHLWLKRVFDIVFSSVAVVLASPVLAAIAVAIKLESAGPVFYASERIGHKGGVFTCYKFRTMVPNADALRSELAHLNERSGILFKITKDPRITRVGAVLRKYSLDELPQLWNVLRGDMSLVGPRPSIRSEVVQYQTPHLRRLDVVPGMTGLWQVEARRDPSFDSYVTLDSKYVNEWSLWLDMKIIFRTVSVVLNGTGV